MIHTLISLLFWVVFPQSQDAVSGQWVTIDDATGEEKSEISIYIENNRLYGKITRLLAQEDQEIRCSECKGKDKDQPIVGLVIVRGLSEKKGVWESGEILDPKNGKVYRCSIRMSDANTLEVRGYIGFSLFGRTQIWKRKV